MNMMVSATAIAAATPALAATASPDQELIDLFQQLMDRLPAQAAANKRSDELWEEFKARKPVRSDVLKWRIGDNVGYCIDKRMCWCDPFGIATLRDVPQYVWTLPERNQSAFDALPEGDQLLEYGAPKPHVQHLFSKTPSPHKQKRIDELAACLDEHTAACDALKLELGCHEAADLLEKLVGPIWDIVERMDEIEPTTVAGLQAKAKMLLCWHWDGVDTSAEDPVAVEIIKGLANLRLAA
jgi:hypothetical protein